VREGWGGVGWGGGLTGGDLDVVRHGAPRREGRPSENDLEKSREKLTARRGQLGKLMSGVLVNMHVPPGGDEADRRVRDAAFRLFADIARALRPAIAPFILGARPLAPAPMSRMALLPKIALLSRMAL